MPSIKPKKGYLTIPQVALKLDCQVAYVRTLLREGKVEVAVKRPLNATQWRWEIPEAWLETRKNLGSRTKREDGRNKWLLWMNPPELEVFTALMAEHLPEVPWAVAYKRQPVPEEVEEEEEDV